MAFGRVRCSPEVVRPLAIGWGRFVTIQIRRGRDEWAVGGRHQLLTGGSLYGDPHYAVVRWANEWRRSDMRDPCPVHRPAHNGEGGRLSWTSRSSRPVLVTQSLVWDLRSRRLVSLRPRRQPCKRIAIRFR